MPPNFQVAHPEDTRALTPFEPVCYHERLTSRRKSLMRVGVHTSIAGALVNAAHHAKKIGCDTFQMFSANPRGWQALDPTPADCEAFRAARHGHGLSPVVIHDNYLINLASSDALIRARSIAAFRR